MTRLTREQILEQRPLPTEDVQVPEWGGVVRVQGLTALQRDTFEAALLYHRNGRVEMNRELMRCKLLCLCIVDETGAPLLKEGDLLHLGRQSAVPIERLFDVAQRLTGWTAADSKAVEEEVKNSARDPHA